MPKAMEEELKKQADKLASEGKLHHHKGRTMQETKNAFVYGILRKTGWKPKQGSPRGKAY
jgi:hypothetical protein